MAEVPSAVDFERGHLIIELANEIDALRGQVLVLPDTAFDRVLVVIEGSSLVKGH